MRDDGEEGKIYRNKGMGEENVIKNKKVEKKEVKWKKCKYGKGLKVRKML